MSKDTNALVGKDVGLYQRNKTGKASGIGVAPLSRPLHAWSFKYMQNLLIHKLNI
jgi:hypothetical protein